VPELWAGTDTGKAAHHCTVIDSDGAKLLSRPVLNDESELLGLIRDVLALAEDIPVTWAVDLNADGGRAADRLAHQPRSVAAPYSWPHGPPCLTRIPGRRQARPMRRTPASSRTRHGCAGSCPPAGMGRDRSRPEDPHSPPLRPRRRPHPRHQPAPRTAAGVLPCTGTAFDYAASRAALVLLTGYQTPSALRRGGPNRLVTWLKNRKVRGAQTLADTAVTAA
jgi:hypothetical protein